MNDFQLTIGAILIEIGVPLAALIIHIRSARYRKRTAVILGAVTPGLVFYAIIAGTYAFGRRDNGTMWAFAAMWIMSFGAYIAALIVGIVASLLPIPTNLYVRYFIGLSLVIGIGAYLGLSGLW